MEVILSKSMGFCMGVKQVVDLAHECLRLAAEQGVPAYSIGWFIHNQRVVNQLAVLGLRHIEKPTDGKPGVALIRAHGITDTLRQSFLEAGFTLIDGTCRNVQASQTIIRDTDRSDHVVIAGIAGHSETIALAGVKDAGGNFIACHVVQNTDDVHDLPDAQGTWILMTQTTLPASEYKAILQAMKDKYGPSLVVGNHLCPGALRRNKALDELCSQVEAVVVVGGKNSANTMALVRLVEEHGKQAFHVESASEVTDAMRAFSRMGLTAGTSTPQSDIDEVHRALKGN
ncbi:MAG TPA: 4-hydroxy-3-methylbut-2-enyl diphosphate reductase [Planctomycetota bacterium]|nr:4-hydroxy-3-methylbut-2-enyl diphosphate reductase [Planctomycetota bacterium]